MTFAALPRSPRRCDRDARSVGRGRRVGHRRRGPRRPQAVQGGAGAGAIGAGAARRRVRAVQRHRARRCRRAGADPRRTGRARDARRPARRRQRVEPDLERVRGIQAAAAEQATRASTVATPGSNRPVSLLVDARNHVQRWQLPDGFDAIGPDPSAAIGGAAGAARSDRATDRRARPRVAQVGEEPVVPHTLARAGGAERAWRR